MDNANDSRISEIKLSKKTYTEKEFMNEKAWNSDLLIQNETMIEEIKKLRNALARIGVVAASTHNKDLYEITRKALEETCL